MTTRKTWRCFHCDAVFRRSVDAAEHFGTSQGASTACQIKGHEHNLIRVIREQEQRLASYGDDRDEIMFAMLQLQGELVDAVRRAEEAGYGRGVHDMQALATQQFGAPVRL